MESKSIERSECHSLLVLSAGHSYALNVYVALQF